MRPCDIPLERELKDISAMQKVILHYDSYKVIWPVCWRIRMEDGFFIFFTKAKSVNDEMNERSGIETKLDSFWPHGSECFTIVKVDPNKFNGFQII